MVLAVLPTPTGLADLKLHLCRLNRLINQIFSAT